MALGLSQGHWRSQHPLREGPVGLGRRGRWAAKWTPGNWRTGASSGERGRRPSSCCPWRAGGAARRPPSLAPRPPLRGRVGRGPRPWKALTSTARRARPVPWSWGWRLGSASSHASLPCSRGSQARSPPVPRAGLALPHASQGGEGMPGGRPSSYVARAAHLCALCLGFLISTAG